MSFKTSVLVLALFSLISYIASKIFLFFGIPSSTYLIYLIYGYALGIWNMTLPAEPIDLFANSEKNDSPGEPEI